MCAMISCSRFPVGCTLGLCSINKNSWRLESSENLMYMASRPPRSWNGEGEVLGVVPLLRAEGSEEASQVGLVLTQDVRQSEAETMILLRDLTHHSGGSFQTKLTNITRDVRSNPPRS